MYNPEECERLILNMRQLLDAADALEELGCTRLEDASELIKRVPQLYKAEVKDLILRINGFDTSQSDPTESD